LAEVYRESGEVAQAAAVALECRKQLPADPDALYAVARELALCSAAGKEKSELPTDEQARRREYADQAVDALRQAVACGYRDVEQVKKDRDLDVLRDRDDFRNLLAGLEPRGKPDKQ